MRDFRVPVGSCPAVRSITCRAATTSVGKFWLGTVHFEMQSKVEVPPRHGPRIGARLGFACGVVLVDHGVLAAAAGLYSWTSVAPFGWFGGSAHVEDTTTSFPQCSYPALRVQSVGHYVIPSFDLFWSHFGPGGHLGPPPLR